MDRRSFLKGMLAGAATVAAPAILIPERRIWQVSRAAPVAAKWPTLDELYGEPGVAVHDWALNVVNEHILTAEEVEELRNASLSSRWARRFSEAQERCDREVLYGSGDGTMNVVSEHILTAEEVEELCAVGHYNSDRLRVERGAQERYRRALGEAEEAERKWRERQAADRVLYGGAAGPGKSEALRAAVYYRKEGAMPHDSAEVRGNLVSDWDEAMSRCGPGEAVVVMPHYEEPLGRVARRFESVSAERDAVAERMLRFINGTWR